MAAITLTRLKIALVNAYEQGYHGALDLKENCAEEIISMLLGDQEPATNKNDLGWRIFTVKELQKTKIGTMFIHVSHGKGWIEKYGSTTYMVWHDGFVSNFFNDEPPWTELMKEIGMTTKSKPPQLHY